MSRLLPLTALAVTLLTLGLGFQASAQDAAPPRPGPRQELWQGPGAARLNLTEAQKKSLQELRARHEPALSAKRKAASEARAAYAQAMAKPETRPEELKALHQTSSNLAFEAQLGHRALRQEMDALLTPEQRARLEGRREGRREGRAGGRQRFHRG